MPPQDSTRVGFVKGKSRTSIEWSMWQVDRWTGTKGQMDRPLAYTFLSEEEEGELICEENRTCSLL